jgi:hypothetical protein
LIDAALALRHRREQIAVLQFRKKLALLDMIAAANEKLLHRRRDLGYHVSLVLREQDSISPDDAADGRLSHGCDLDGRRRLNLGFLLFRASG